jgi:protease I
MRRLSSIKHPVYAKVRISFLARSANEEESVAVEKKTALLVVAADGYRDEEYEATRTALERAGVKVMVASTVTQGARSLNNKTINPEMLIENADPAAFDGVIFIGGFGCSQFWHDAKAHRLVRTLHGDNRLVAAIGRAPVTLGAAGVLKSKKVTGHISVFEKLANYGADYTGGKVERVGNLVTGVGPNGATQFATTVSEVFGSR